jgi:hypothetical protein
VHGSPRIVWTFAVSLVALVAVLMLATGGVGPKELLIALAWSAGIAFAVFVMSRIRVR